MMPRKNARTADSRRAGSRRIDRRGGQSRRRGSTRSRSRSAAVQRWARPRFDRRPRARARDFQALRRPAARGRRGKPSDICLAARPVGLHREPTRALMRALPLAVSAVTVTSALGAGVATHAAALRERRGGLRRNDFTASPLETWIGRVTGLEGIDVPETASRLDSRNNRLAWLAL